MEGSSEDIIVPKRQSEHCQDGSIRAVFTENLVLMRINECNYGT